MGPTILRVLLNKIWIILCVPLAAGMVAFLFTRSIEKNYKSTAKLSTGFTVKKESKTVTGNDDYWESQVYFDDFIEIMKSEPTGSMVSYQLLLHDLSEGKPFRASVPLSLSRSERDSAKTILHASVASFKLMSSFDEFENRIMGLQDKKDYNLAKWIKEGALTIERIKDTDYIKVEFVSEDPSLSAFVVNAVSQEAIRYNNSLSNTHSDDSVQFFANEALKKKKELEDKTERLRKRTAENRDDGDDKESSAKSAELATYQNRLQGEENRASGIFLSLKNIKSKIAEYEKLPTKVNHSEPPRNDKLIELQNKINELNKIYADNGSSDKALAGTIGKLRDQLEKKKAKLALAANNAGKSNTVDKPNPPVELIAESKKVESDYKQAESRIFSLRAKINQLRSNYSKRAKTTNPPGSTIASLQQEHDTAFKEYARAVEKLKERKNKALMEGPGIKLLIPGKPSDDPESSKALARMAVVMMGTFILCLAKIILGEYFRATGFWPLIGPNRSTYRKIFSRRVTL